MSTTQKHRAKERLASRGARYCLLVAVGILALAGRAEALTVASDTWSDEELDSSFHFRVYGRGVAETQVGWLEVSASLRAPSGSGLAWNWGDGCCGSASAEASATVNAETMESGSYSTLAQAMDEQQNAGCAASTIDITNYYDWALRSGTCTGGVLTRYFSQCSGTCLGDTACWADVGPRAQAMGLRFRTYWAWCGGRVWVGTSGGVCAPPLW
jgi:hypothetical protein